MHISTHILSGWCIANTTLLNKRERLFCMIAASVQDLDGLGIIFGQNYYWDWHHVLFHNLLSAIVLTGALTFFSEKRIKGAILYFSLFHLHLLMDIYFLLN